MSAPSKQTTMLDQYQAYMLRIWPVNSRGSVRATLTSVSNTEEYYHFDSLDGLFQFLQGAAKDEVCETGGEEGVYEASWNLFEQLG